jgi:hypothetical protein
MLDSSEGRPPARRALPLRVRIRRQLFARDFIIPPVFVTDTYPNMKKEYPPAGTICFIFQH